MLLDLAKKHNARDTTQRKTAIAELEATIPRHSQYAPGTEIPERSWAVRLAKWIAFNDFGAYGKFFKADEWIDPSVPKTYDIDSVAIVPTGTAYDSLGCKSQVESEEWK